MFSFTFFIIFIPLLSFSFLLASLIFSTLKPYHEKNSTYESGYRSFNQTRVQFNISFFIFALLFLLFDLEILLLYPYATTAYVNDAYGLIIVILFIVLLTLGFVFEFGKKALTIVSKQTVYNTKYPLPGPGGYLIMGTKTKTTGLIGTTRGIGGLNGSRSFHTSPILMTKPLTEEEIHNSL